MQGRVRRKAISELWIEVYCFPNQVVRKKAGGICTRNYNQKRQNLVQAYAFWSGMLASGSSSTQLVFLVDLHSRLKCNCMRLDVRDILDNQCASAFEGVFH